MALRVCCICLTADRQAQTDRAVVSFLDQTYTNKHILIWDSGMKPYVEEPHHGPLIGGSKANLFTYLLAPRSETIGAMRNQAIAMAGNFDAFAHWDSDDWSHPERLAYQVSMLEAGAEVTGVGSMIVWNSTVNPGVAWEYASVHADKKYCVGASLCYKISAWQREKFPDRQVGEDKYWGPAQNAVRTEPYAPDGMPLLVAEIHGSNTALHKSFESRIVPGVQGWTRRRDMDERIAEVMKL